MWRKRGDEIVCTPIFRVNELVIVFFGLLVGPTSKLLNPVFDLISRIQDNLCDNV